MRKLLWILPILLLTGCYNYRELNQLAIATGFGIDKENDEYVLTVMIANSNKQSSDSDNASASTTVYEGRGKTIYDALKDASLSISKQIYVGHIDVLVISEEVAKESVTEVLDLFFRYPQTRNDYYLVISKDSKAGDVLKITMPLESFPSQNIAKNLEISNRLQGYTYAVDFNYFVKDTLKEGINPVLPSVYLIGNVEEGNKEENIEENAPSTYLKLGTLGLFKKDSLVVWADLDQSIGINIINDHIDVMGITVQLEEGSTVTEITQMKTKVEIDKDNPLKVKIKVQARGGIQEAKGQINLSDVEIIKQIAQKDEEQIKIYIEKALLLAQENETDCFGFGNAFYKKNPSKWKEIASNWNEEWFPNITVEVEAKVDLTVKGVMNKTVEVMK